MEGKTFFRKIALLLGFFAIFFGIPPAVFQSVRVVDQALCSPLFLPSGTLAADASLGKWLHPLVLPEAAGGTVSFSIANQSDETLSLCLCQLYFPHRIFEDEKTVSQNIDPESAHFDPSMRNKTFRIPPQSSARFFRIEGAGVDEIHAYLARTSTLLLQQRIAGELNTFLSLVISSLGLLMLIVSIAHKRLGALEASVLLVFVFCLLKISILHTSAFGSVVFSIPADQFRVWDAVTTFGFSLSMFLIYAFFFDVQPRRVFYPALVGYALFMLVDFVVTTLSHGAVILLPVVLLCRVLLFVWILGFAVWSRKPFAKSVVLMHAISDGLIIYYVFLKNHPAAAGPLAFYVDLAFLGFSIQFLFALVLLISRTLIQARDYNRLLMLRGLEHDLKIPLSVIKLNHQMIQRYSLRDDDSNGNRFSGAIDRALADLDGMLQNLRYHLENRFPAQKTSTDLAPLFVTLEENFRAVSVARNAILDIEIPETGLCVAIDPDVLKRILLNLIENAFKHGGTELRIFMCAKKKSGKVAITLQDNGAGMTRSERRKSVRLFHKTDPARGTPGLGLGLHVVRNLIRQNHGTLEIKSKKGEGTVITFLLPRA